MDDSDLVPDPGVIAAGGGDELENLEPDFTPTLSNLFSSTPMDDTDADTLAGIANLSDPTTQATIAGDLGGSSPLDTSILGWGESLSSGLLNAFVVAPQNAQTQEGLATTSTELSLASSSQLFSYLLIGLVLFLVVGAFSKK